ncbi:hypothetical protein CAPTEDRAFT_220186 [Capitella teleta]|uniref:Sodium/solute symporter n=1 Tax=Capitella teleta TaxID=283909 RepID=R7V9Q4_CAPTE|nr:hypothetical protein CAPTEDRAFT_220186 [Capitella teleta]|eukprot:ELU15573.1 hypothetical protein CAPTEDRAFT_220186 [Capitella teleta]
MESTTTTFLSSEIQEHTLHWTDYLVFAIFLVLNIGLGIWQSVRTKNSKNAAEDFLVGNRKMNWVPIGLALVMSHVSTITVLGTPAKIYTEGGMFWSITIGYIIGSILAVLLMVPLLYPLKLTSATEYLESRYHHKGPKFLAHVYMILFYIVYAGISLYSPATAMESVTRIPLWALILIEGGVTIIYTTLGGMKASTYASVMQCILMLAGVIVVIVKFQPISLRRANNLDHYSWRECCLFDIKRCSAIQRSTLQFGPFIDKCQTLTMSLTGLAAGPELGLYALGAFFPCATWQGAVGGSLSALGIMTWIQVGAEMSPDIDHYLDTNTNNCSFLLPHVNSTNASDTSTTPLESLYHLSTNYYYGLGAFLTVFIGLIVTAVFGCRDPIKADKKYHIPIFSRLCWLCLPRKSLNILQCKIRTDEEEDNSVDKFRLDTVSTATTTSISRNTSVDNMLTNMQGTDVY